jgi:VWFA-related protein
MPRPAALLLVGLAAAAAAQPPDRPFRRRVEGVQIDVRAVDRDGRFVRDLTKDDVTVFEDGREQSITAFDLVEIPVVAERAPAVPIVDPDVASNAVADQGRIYLIVLDDLHTHPLRSVTVRALAREFIERNLGPNDRAALIATSGRRELATEFTGNRGLLLDRAGRFEGGFAAGAQCGSDKVPCLADEQATMRYLTTLAKWLAGLDGRRKALLFISEGFDSGISDAFTDRDGLSRVTDAASDMREVIDAAARSNVSIFAIDPRGLPGAPAATVKPVTTLSDDDAARAVIARHSLEILANETGGFALVRSNAFSDAFARVVSESSSYYMLGYTSNNTTRDGKFRRIEVRAKRPGLVIRARSGYVAREDKPAAPPQKSASIAPALADALASPLQLPGVTLTMSAAAFRDVKSKASVAVIVEARGGELPLAVIVAAANPDGAIKGEEHGTLDLKPSAAPGPPAEDRTVRLVSRLKLSSGRYQLRVAALDRAGAAGSVHFDMEVPDFTKGPLAMSGLMLASAAAASEPTGGTDRSWKEVLADPPTAVRAFAAGDRVSLFAEIYDNGGKAGDRLEITTSIRSDAGETAFTRREMLSRKEGGQSVSHQYSETIPLTGVAPGRYLLTVDARRTSNPAHHASRQIPISVR